MNGLEFQIFLPPLGLQVCATKLFLMATPGGLQQAAPCTFHGGGTESQRDKEACSWHPAKKRSFRDWTTSLPVSSTRFRVPGWSRCWKDNERQRQQQTLDYTGAGAHTCDLSTGESQAGGPLELQASWAITGNPLKIRT